MPNPYLPTWEYVPDGEPRVFGDRVYVYGSHDRVNCDQFCDFKLKVWSAPVDNLNEWTCHGHIFHTKDDKDHTSDTPWTEKELYAPDVVEKDGKYYLYAYIVGAKGCVAVSDSPEGPFTLLSKYKNETGPTKDDDIFIDPGTLVDDDGRVYVYCGYLSSFIAELNPDNMYEVIEGSYSEDIVPVEEPFNFFEACSPRKVDDTYYMIYSPKTGNQLVYATSNSPTGPFEYRGVIIDNGVDYPAGNNHGSICKINDQWYIFYHRMTNNSIMSRRGCVERIEILPDGIIPQVEMTSQGFEKALNPYKETPAELACVLTGGCYIVERTAFDRPVSYITDQCVIGYKYFDFGTDDSNTTIKFMAKVRGLGGKCNMKILLDDPKSGTEVGICHINTHDGVYETTVSPITGIHAVYFVIQSGYSGWFYDAFKDKHLFDFESFVFMK